MKILLVEDDNHKAEQVADYLKAEINELNLVIAKSFHSGMLALEKADFNIILLDMSMPTYDVDIGDVFNRHRNYAGEDFLYEMQNLNIMIDTIIITQYDVIGEGKNQMDAKQLNNRYKDEFSDFYRGLIRYDSSITRWKDELLTKIKEIEGS